MSEITQPDGKNVCPGCGGYVDHDEYKCDKCTGGGLWDEE